VNLDAVFQRQFERVAELSSRLARRVDVAALDICDRSGLRPLGPPGRTSPNGACRLVRATDGWIAVNLAREEDQDLVPAWLHGDVDEDPWALIERALPTRTRADLLSDARMLGLPVAAVGEVRSRSTVAPTVIEGPMMTRPAGKPLKVVDLSALWAGPMCGAILAAMGADVVKVESVRRPDPTRTSMPEFFRRLNGAKTDVSIDFADPAHLAWLREEVMAAEVVISSARARAFRSLGFTPKERLRASPGSVWIAVTGYGWYGPDSDRVAFGDDAAAAGGLVRWTERGEPHFIGDALADPLTGLAATIGALDALIWGGGRLVNAGMAHAAAGAAAEAGLQEAA
jgi:crotonobetainyl-CoA:carnitine CoA-transferase CaiB-like acyl-CoA transferase